MKSRVVVSVLIEKDGELLFGRKKANRRPYPNTWLTIGGGVDLETETLEEGLRREVREETGLELSNIRKLAFDEDVEPDNEGKDVHYLFLTFVAQCQSGTAKAGDDIVELKWVPIEDLSKINLPRPTIKLFKELKWL
jgi:ADP-ribose pyrophosphatase YjhB (NUDIX family)